MTALLDSPTMPAPAPAAARPVPPVSGVAAGLGTVAGSRPVVFAAAHLDRRRPVQAEDTALVSLRFPIDLDHVAGMLWHLIGAGHTLGDLAEFTTADLLAAFLSDGMMAAVVGDADLGAVTRDDPAHPLALAVTTLACDLFDTGRAGERP